MMVSHLVISLGIAAILCFQAVLVTTIYLHRTKTHKALELNPILDWVFKVDVWITMGIRVLEWVAVHLKHHAFTDKEGDPHSPKLEGFWPVQLGNVFYYMREKNNPETIERYGRPHVAENAWDRRLFNHGSLGIGLGTTVLCGGLFWFWGLSGIGWGIFAAAAHGITYVFFLSSSINGLCHMVGYKNFDNTATNIRSLALITGGEGLHNNHHAYPRSPKLSYRLSELDPAWPIIKLLAVLRLAKLNNTIEQTVRPQEVATA